MAGKTAFSLSHSGRDKTALLSRLSRRDSGRDETPENPSKTACLTRDSTRDESPYCLAVSAFPPFRGKAGETEGRDTTARHPMTTQTVLGIDPGAHGATAVLDDSGALLHVVDMLVTKEASGRMATNTPLWGRRP